MALLLTGGAGYIGSIVAEYCINAGYDLIILDDLREGNIKSLPNSVKFYQVNYGDKKALQDIFTNNAIDCVIHLAASSNVPHSVIVPELYYSNNITNTLTLLECMQEFGVRKFIFSSSAAIYGEPEYQPVDENHAHIPINPYGKSKLFVEEILKDLANSNKLKFVAFRFFCAAGATAFNGESRKDETHLIPLVVDCALRKKDEMYVFGNKFNTIDGSGVRDYVHVADIAQAHVLALKNFDTVANDFFNIGTDSGNSVLELVALAEKIFHRKIPMKIVDSRPGDPESLVASSAKIRKDLGWKPLFGLEQILLSTFLWRKNPRY